MSPLSPGLEEAEGGGRRRRAAPRTLSEEKEEEPFSLKGDKRALLLLLLLYTLQGVPLGLAATVSTLLQEKGASYQQQGTPSGCRRCDGRLMHQPPGRTPGLRGAHGRSAAALRGALSSSAARTLAG